ncbi:D-alanyl-D-alanine carboxypeptidase [Paenibacillus pini JCM 16418]|uniref:D-alanyl-D-alanine carboxypeptidase n=1 Tax=Paenibacillus pini JCM 16418 TaxID=1236976 RepID=W7Z1Z9_9BACL|nr:D-alanyl-D-alanine carboxypeptidase [Paenibacillus pini JCM 16418]
MKKWFFLFIILLLLGLKVFHNQDGDSNSKDERIKKETSNVEDIDSSKGIIKWSKNQVHQGNLLLISPDYPVQDEAIQSDIVKLFNHKELVQGYGLLDASIQLSEDIARKWLQVVDAAKQDGVDHFLISSGYRDHDKQNELFLEKGKDIAMPAGASEHNLGLSMDIGSSLMKMSKAPEGEWLKEHAWEYGFVVRYPEDKVQITGIKYELGISDMLAYRIV